MADSKFVIVGTPRTGTTLLVDMLNSHENVFCDNELYNPHQIARFKSVGDTKGLSYRNSDPVRFWDEFYNSEFSKGYESIGFNYMLGHEVVVLEQILLSPEVDIIYVYRDNKLAQYASFKKALDDKQWATRDKSYSADDAWKENKINFSLGDFEEWRQTINCLSHMFISLARHYAKNIMFAEYRDIVRGNLDDSLCAFLAVDTRPLVGGIVKQGTVDILDRFGNQDEVRNYMNVIGKKYWAGNEF